MLRLATFDVGPASVAPAGVEISATPVLFTFYIVTLTLNLTLTLTLTLTLPQTLLGPSLSLKIVLLSLTISELVYTRSDEVKIRGDAAMRQGEGPRLSLWERCLHLVRHHLVRHSASKSDRTQELWCPATFLTGHMVILGKHCHLLGPL